MLDLATYLPKLKEFEGVFSHMYLDTTDNVTVGAGQLLANVAAAQTLAFVLRPDPSANPPVSARPATPDEIRVDFEKVSQQAAGRLASFYKQFTKLDLPENAIDAVLHTKVEEFLASISAKFPDFNSYPAQACAAIFDMAYNLGVEKLTSEFPNFSKAVKARDWSGAAGECQRRGIGDARNNWTKAQLENAAADAKAAKA
jgi:GH24 family phage-related lysozyme (muramidase)